MRAAGLAGNIQVDGPLPISVSGLSISLSQRIEDVEREWNALESQGIDSPGQGLAFVKSWLAHFDVAEADRVFLLASLGHRPIALFPLYRSRSMGLKTISWLTGDHLGHCMPLIDRQAFAALSCLDKHQLWTGMKSLPFDADHLMLANVPVGIAELTGLGTAFGSIEAADKVHRARFASWQECDAAQRNKHRRKIDRQQATKLEAFGPLEFEVYSAGDAVDEVLDTMFAQKAARFMELGITDPFAAQKTRDFYRDVFHRAGGVLHVLKTNGRIVAVRYNLAAGGGLHCLISSMTTCAATQAGSPGKQGLLRVMQSAFDDGHAFIDMGRGENDEKRQWCNEQIDLAGYCRPLTPLGHLALVGQQFNEQMRLVLKGNKTYFNFAKRLRKTVAGRRG